MDYNEKTVEERMDDFQDEVLAQVLKISRLMEKEQPSFASSGGGRGC
jgi:hypothetical protein